MNLNDAPIVVTGNLAEDPVLTFTPSGRERVRLRVLSTPQYFDKSAGEMKDGTTLGIDVTVWGALARNVAESLSKGSRVIITGTIEQENWETEEHQKRSRTVIRVVDIGASLRWAAATIQRNARSGSGMDWAAANAPAQGGWPDETAF